MHQGPASKRILITSALPYINGVKHLGNLVGSMLPADVFARFMRLQGHEVLFICATDEHGTPAELAALEQGLDVATFCREQHAVQEGLAKRFDLSFDHFGRSSSPQNKELTQYFCRRLEANGYIEERLTKQVYSKTDGRFLPDRYVVGTCPHCGNENARGDQCEACTKLLDPTDLINPRSAVSGSADLEVRESKHLFLLQSKFADRIREWITDKNKENWPKLVTSIALKWLNEGLHDRCITRDLAWGVPVDRPGFEGKVFYVWFDAPIEYIAATKEWADENPAANRDWRSWWKRTGDDTGPEYYEFMAKDNVPFHTVSFPCTIMGANEGIETTGEKPWKLVDYIKGFNWLTYYGGKFSTSGKRGVFMNDAIDLLPSDYWRYYLMANAPETNDSSFTWEHFAATVNKDLADTLGNFVNRAFKLTEKHFGCVVPAGGEPGFADKDLALQTADRLREYERCLEAMEFRKAAQELKAMWTLGNMYFDRMQPWKSIKEDREQTACTLRSAIGLVRFYALCSYPFIPGTSARILEALGLRLEDETWPDGSWPHYGSESVEGRDPNWREGKVLNYSRLVEVGREFSIPGPLFMKITPEQLAEWEDRFTGK